MQDYRRCFAWSPNPRQKDDWLVKLTCSPYELDACGRQSELADQMVRASLERNLAQARLRVPRRASHLGEIRRPIDSPQSSVRSSSNSSSNAFIPIASRNSRRAIRVSRTALERRIDLVEAGSTEIVL